jgi:hypothetical protein
LATSNQVNRRPRLSFMVPGWMAPVGVFIASLALYWGTLAPGVVGHDAGEFQFVPYVLGIPHHTGYPLYTLIGFLWSFIPIDSVAYRMNLLSAFIGAGAVLATYLLASSVGRTRLAGLVAAATLAVAPLHWQWSAIAGVRSGSVLLPALVLWLAIEWSRRVPAGTSSSDRWFMAIALAFGASLAHHRSAAYLAPGLFLFILLVDRRLFLRGRLLVVSLLAGAVPLLSYFYLPVRSASGAPFDQFHPDTWARFWDLVLAVPLSQSFFSVPPGELPERIALLAGMLETEFGVVALILAAIGAAALLIRQPRICLLTGCFLGLVAAQTVAWNVGQQRLNTVYFLPAFPVVALLAAAGIYGASQVFGWVEGRLRPGAGIFASRWLMVAGAAAFGILLTVNAAGQFQVRQTLVDAPLDRFRSDLSGGKAAGRLVLGSLPYIEGDALVLTYWEQATPFWYYQLVEKINAGVEIAYSLPEVNEFASRFPGRPIYLAAAVPQAAGKRLTMVGPLVRILDANSTSAPPGLALLPKWRLEDNLDLLKTEFIDREGRFLDSPPVESDVLSMQLYWRAAAPLSADYSISVRLLDASGQVIAQQDNQHPVLGLYPTSKWRSGEVIADYYELPRRTLAKGDYRLVAIVYRAVDGGFRNLRVLDGPGDAGAETFTLAEGISGGR